MSFLNHMFILFVVLTAMLWGWGRLAPLPEPCALPERPAVDVEPLPARWWLGGTILVATAICYAAFF